MNVLVIGNGAREDAICKKISESKKLTKLYCSNGNYGTSRYAKNVLLNSNEEILEFSKKNNIDLVVVGPEKPLCDGIVDLFKESNIKIFGPCKKSSKLEGSKNFSKEFMEKYDIPTAKYKTITSEEKENIEKIIKEFSYPLVLKADGLCMGKGVRICNEKNDAEKYFKELFEDEIFGKEGKKVVIEEFLKGEELSLLCFVSNGKLIEMESARDYKKIFDGDKGENTGGVGCFSPSNLIDEKLNENIKKILEKISFGLKKEKLLYTGILFVGFMIDRDNPKVLEFNVRFGDPETQVLLPRLKSDLLLLIEKCIDGTIEKRDLIWSDKKALTVVLTSKGYPLKYEKNKEIKGLLDVDKEVYIYHNNTKIKENKILTDGGRVISLTALGKDFNTLRKIIYKNIEKISFDNMYYRKDIGKI